MVRRVKFGVKLFASAECEVSWKNSGKHETNTGKLCLLTVTPDPFCLPVKCATLHIHTKGGRLFATREWKVLCVALKSASFRKLQLCCIQQANWNNWKLNKQGHMSCDIWSAVEAFHSRKGRSFFFFFKFPTQQQKHKLTNLPSQLNNLEHLFYNRKIFNLKNISDIKTKFHHFHELIKKIIFKKAAHNYSPAFTHFWPRR